MKTSVLSTIALLCGVLGLCLSCIFIGAFPAIVGLILGIIALNDDLAYKWPSICAIACSAVALMMAVVVMTQSETWNTPNVATPTEIVQHLTNPDENGSAITQQEPTNNLTAEERPKTEMTEQLIATPAPKKENNQEVVYSDDNLIISYKGYSGSEDDYDFDFEIENLSERNFTIQVRNVVMNGYTVSDTTIGLTCSMDVMAKSKAKDDISIDRTFDDTLPKMSEINSVRLKFHIFDYDDWLYEYDSNEIILK